MNTLIKLTIVTVFGCAVLGLFISLPVWVLWNWVGVDVLGLKEITLWQALGVSLLSTFLFKSNTTKSNS